MTYLGYSGVGDGDTDEAPLGEAPRPNLYDARAFYFIDGPGMPPPYTVNNRVYIVRHGDGRGHTAIQISGMEGTDPRNYQITYRNLD